MSFPIMPVIQSKSFEPDLGDILYGANFISGHIKDKNILDLKKLPICLYNDGNPWVVLPNRFKIDARNLEKAVQYKCPYTRNIFYWILPHALILKKNSVEYYGGNKDQYAFDLEWWKNLSNNPGKIVMSLLGHGYTEGTLPCDGVNSIELVTIDLDNGDQLLAFCWFWYNK
jgi:hypothetical protein